GLLAEALGHRARLIAGELVRVREVAASAPLAQTPLATLHDAPRNEILLLAAEGDDLVFRLRTRAAAVQLDAAAIRATEILCGFSAGDVVTISVSRAGRRYCADVNGQSRGVRGGTVGVG